jgi:hypothetical protein
MFGLIQFFLKLSQYGYHCLPPTAHQANVSLVAGSDSHLEQSE